jgi:hypothetical protein
MLKIPKASVRAVPVASFKQLVLNQPNVYRVNPDGSVCFDMRADYDRK